jgi:hypothetical protein
MSRHDTDDDAFAETTGERMVAPKSNEHRGKQMAGSPSNRRRLADMTVHELARLRLLNDKLLQTENWIHRRATRCLFDYHNAGGLMRARPDAHTYEDVELDATVTCILRETHPEYKSDEDNVVAKLNAGLLLNNEDVLGNWNWNEVWEQEPHPLSDMHFCWLFHDLFDHQLKGNWDRMVDIGGVRVEVMMAQQREEYWQS